jgi:hypothetical protein
MDSFEALPRVPIVRYGQENKDIPGDPTGWFLKDCGNICHWSDLERFEVGSEGMLRSRANSNVQRFPKFDDANSKLLDDPRIDSVKRYLSDMINEGIKVVKEHGIVIKDTDEEIVIDDIVKGFSSRIIQLKDVSFEDKRSYSRAARAKAVEIKSDKKMKDIEHPAGHKIEDFLIAQRMSQGEAPTMPMHRRAPNNPQGSEDRKKWYKSMRTDASHTFWVKNTRQERDAIRAAAKKLPDELTELVEQIRREDTSHSKDYFWQYQKDEYASQDADIYEMVNRDILIVLDCDSNVVVCKISRLFQFLYGEDTTAKVDRSVRDWAGLAP